jgi:hypothetical protein
MNPGEVWGLIDGEGQWVGRRCDAEHGIELGFRGVLVPELAIEWLLGTLLTLEARWLAEMPQSLDTGVLWDELYPMQVVTVQEKLPDHFNLGDVIEVPDTKVTFVKPGEKVGIDLDGVTVTDVHVTKPG